MGREKNLSAAPPQTRRDVNRPRPRFRFVLSVEDEDEDENLICLQRILILNDSSAVRRFSVWGKLRWDESQMHRAAHEAGHVMDIELGHQFRTMRLDGFDAQAQKERYLFSALALSNQLQDFTPARRQMLQRRGIAFDTLKVIFEDAFGNAWAKKSSTAPH